MVRDIRFQKVIKEANIQDGFKILDLGGGDGILKKYIPKRVDYLLIDYLPKRKFYNPLTKVGDYINYNLEDGLPESVKKQKFDVIFLLEFIEHIENFKSLLFQCKNCLKDKGKIIITTPTNHRFILGEDPTHIHCFRKSNLYNLAKMLEMKIKIKGTYIRIPKIEILIPSSNILYNEVFLVTLEK
jgi:2-polyprenyl-3-methyl-5-hydroxy-6-metoxy-1,4-benzoquinol methylase